jgi:peptidoglycan/xylan/chitin deacetylase (PgdA/CDA1 family)
MILRQLHEELRQHFPTALWQGNPARREIALTFDDGPDAEATPALLALLDRHSVAATFFQIGTRVAAAPTLVRSVIDAGHQIGLHGYEHQSFLLKTAATLRQELAQTQALLAAASGRDPQAFNAVRPPFGHFTPVTLRTLVEAGYLPTMWSLVPFHWLQSAEATVRQIRNGVNSGAILVLHEGLSGPPVADLAAAVLPGLLAEGYRFVTIGEMWANRLAVDDSVAG